MILMGFDEQRDSGLEDIDLCRRQSQTDNGVVSLLPIFSHRNVKVISVQMKQFVIHVSAVGDQWLRIGPDE